MSLETQSDSITILPTAAAGLAQVWQPAREATGHFKTILVAPHEGSLASIASVVSGRESIFIWKKSKEQHSSFFLHNMLSKESPVAILSQFW